MMPINARRTSGGRAARRRADFANRFAIPAWTCALLFVLASTPANALLRRPTTPEGVALQKAYGGQFSEARNDFGRILSGSFQQLNGLLSQGVTDSNTLARYTILVTATVRTFDMWQSAEALATLVGDAIPDEVCRDMQHYARELPKHARRTVELASQILDDSDQESWMGKLAARVPERTAHCIDSVVILLRDTIASSERGSLLRLSNDLLSRKRSLAEHDAAYESVKQTFSLTDNLVSALEDRADD